MSKDFAAGTETRRLVDPIRGEVIHEVTLRLGVTEDVWLTTLAELNSRSVGMSTLIWEKAPQRQIAHDYMVSSPDPTMKVVRGLALAVLSELNILRTAASLAPRTQQQLINAILSKIDDGSAD